MRDKVQHIIQKQIFDIRHGRHVDAYAKQTEICTRYQNEVIPLLEKVCLELCPEDRLVKIDTLIVELPPMDESGYKNRWVEEVEKAFRESLYQAIRQAAGITQQNNTRVLSRTDADLQLLTSFLYTGFLPWSYLESQNRDLVTILKELIVKEAASVRRLLMKGLKQESFTKRLCYQFPASLLSDLFFIIEPAYSNAYQSLNQCFEKAGYFKSRSNAAFLINYYSLGQLSKHPYQDEKQFIAQVIQHMSYAWKIPYPELLSNLIKAIKPIAGQSREIYFLSNLEDLYKVLLKDFPLQKKNGQDATNQHLQLTNKRDVTDQHYDYEELKPEKVVAENHLRWKLQQLLREVKQIKYVLEEEKGQLYKDLKKQLKQFIKHVENHPSGTVKNYESLLKGLKQLLRRLETDNIIASEEGYVSFKVFLKNLLKEFSPHQENGSAAVENYFQWELQELLQRVEQTTYVPEEKKGQFYEGLKKQLKQFIKQVENHPSETVKNYESLLKGLKKLLRRLETDNIIVSEKGYGNFKASLKNLIKEFSLHQENESAAAEHHFQWKLQQLLREVEQITNVSGKEKEKLYDSFRERLAQFMRLVEEGTPKTVKIYESLVEDLKQLLQESGSDSKAYESFKKSLQTVLEKFTQRTENKWKEPKWQQDQEKLNPKEIYLQNAGLVIIWSFLTQLFEELKLTEKQHFMTEEKQHRAIHLLQYLANSDEHYSEHLLGLNKLLCGLNLNEPVPQYVMLTEEEKESAKDLIKAAIDHWPMMQNTSVEGFREAFLMREGKLSHDSNGWLLQVAQKSYDVIMDKLPWTISLVKLPWMPEPLFVEW